MHSNRGTYGWILLACLSLGCGDSEMSARDKHCQTICAELEKCDSDTDVMGCEEACKAETYRSEAYLAAKARCTADLSCKQYEDEVDSQGQSTCRKDCVLSDCIGDELRQQTLGEEDEKRCTTLGNRLADCDDTLDQDAVESRCTRTLPWLSEDYAAASFECVDLRCADVDACFADLVDMYDSDVALFSRDASD